MISGDKKHQKIIEGWTALKQFGSGTAKGSVSFSRN
jgi:hypothetical protein